MNNTNQDNYRKSKIMNLFENLEKLSNELESSKNEEKIEIIKNNKNNFLNMKNEINNIIENVENKLNIENVENKLNNENVENKKISKYNERIFYNKMRKEVIEIQKNKNNTTEVLYNIFTILGSGFVAFTLGFTSVVLLGSTNKKK